MIMFSETNRNVAATAEYVLVPVSRKNGADGQVSVRYRTENGDALEGE